jgi:hypothetical protein
MVLLYFTKFNKFKVKHILNEIFEIFIIIEKILIIIFSKKLHLLKKYKYFVIF